VGPALRGVGWEVAERSGGIGDTPRGTVGDGCADRLMGGSGDDVLVGAGGTDVLSAGSGTDRCDGGWGSDTVSGCESAYNVP
jgi:Ca2+-binding RTX toxin-like protein